MKTERLATIIFYEGHSFGGIVTEGNDTRQPRFTTSGTAFTMPWTYVDWAGLVSWEHARAITGSDKPVGLVVGLFLVRPLPGRDGQ